MPSWSGEALADRSILLFGEGGFGDVLQFYRYVPQVAAAARSTILVVHPPLVRLLSRLPKVSVMTSRDIRPACADVWCALMSLPHVIGTTLESIPATMPYVTAEPADIARWNERLTDVKGLRVGLCWGGGQDQSHHPIVNRRAIPLETFAPLGEIPGVEFISLQKGPAAAEAVRPPPGLRLHDLTQDLHDLADTAALMENLDLIISVDTAVAHLAGALGKPIWLLNRFNACWRWLEKREDSPWYPSLRQFRQPTPRDWHSVITRVRGALERLNKGDRGQLRPLSSAGSA